MSKRKICVITGTRAEYGLLYWLMREIKNDQGLQLQLIVTGMHLSPEFGLTYRNIEKNGFKIDKKIEILLSSDTEPAISKSIGLGCISFAEAFKELKPDIIVVLGDRFEIFAAAISAVITRIPIAHLHGGEITEGVIDEPIRHSITKMASIHFPATEIYARRIIQMGENPDNVYNYGMAGLDNIHKLKLLSQKELEKRINFSLKENTALITYHPVTLEGKDVERQIENLLNVIKDLNLNVIFTKSNADTYGRIINQKITEFIETNINDDNNYKLYDNLGQLNYLSLLQFVGIMIGNSSSGFTEAPSFHLPVINIGNRQKGRIRARNIVNCGYSIGEINRAIKKGLDKKFKSSLKNMDNPYDKFGDGKTSFRIKEILKKINIDSRLIKKSFYDLDFDIK